MKADMDLYSAIRFQVFTIGEVQKPEILSLVPAENGVRGGDSDVGWTKVFDSGYVEVHGGCLVLNRGGRVPPANVCQFWEEEKLNHLYYYHGEIYAQCSR